MKIARSVASLQTMDDEAKLVTKAASIIPSKTQLLVTEVDGV